MLKQLAQQLPDSAFMAGYNVGMLHLTGDLWFAKHHGIQPAGDFHRMSDRLFMVIDI